MSKRQPEGPPPAPVAQKVWVRYAKRGRLRFTSHRDFARALERALRRARVPIAYSAGFSPHPKVSYVGAAPTGVSSEAEYLELGLAELVDAEALRAALDASLPDGLDIVACIAAPGGSLPERIDASHWRVELPGVTPDQVQEALTAFLAEDAVLVEKRTKDGKREIDARAAVVTAQIVANTVGGDHCAILSLVVRHTTPAVRPDDILSGLRSVAPLELTSPPLATRLAQGRLDGAGRLLDPLAADRAHATEEAAVS